MTVDVTDVFYQGYTKEEGIPPHWCIQWFEKGWAHYAYLDNREEVKKWLQSHAFNALEWMEELGL